MPQTDPGVDTGRQPALKWEFCFKNNIEISDLVNSYLIVKLTDGCWPAIKYKLKTFNLIILQGF